MELTANVLESPVAEEIPATEPVKLYAGKYKSIQELEKAYTNSSTVFNENRALKEKYKVPENYVVPEVSLPETVINDLQQLAKSAGFNQEQFDKTIVSIHEQKKQQQTQLESKKQQLGDQLKVVEDYVMKNYPHALYDTILTTLLGDENAMSDAMKHRDQVLNSQVPGLNNQRGNFSDTYDGKAELINLAREYEKNPTEKNKNRYINLAKEVAEARSGK